MYRNGTSFIKKLHECTEMERNESHFLIYNFFVCDVSQDFDQSINYSIERVSEWLSGWMSEWVCLIDWESEELDWLIDWLIEWVSEWVSGPVPAWY